MKSKFKRRSATFKPSNTPPNQVVKSSVTETPKAKEEVNMVKRNTRSSTSPAISTRRRHGVTMDLMMDCQDDDLSPSQIDYMRKCRLEYDNAMTLIKDAQNKARLGKATVSIQKNVNKSGSVLPISPGNAVTPKQQETPNRPSSPDVIIVGETPPKQKPSTPVTAAKTRSPVGKSPQQIVVRPLQNAGNIQQQQRVQQPTFLKVIPVTSPSAQFPFAPAQHNLVANRQTLRPLYQQQQFVAAQNSASNMLMNSAMQAKRNLENVQDADGPLRKKQKKVETNEVGNWVPLDEYYYGKMEGDPSYVEEKGEFRFKCWYCSKMLYNNVKAMMHIQGHIDSGKQHNLDLSDLTQCKHCYKQFDTPFEMQTHVEKVHMNGANVLLCRICERDHESRNALTHHMRQNHTACEMPYICQLCSFRSSMYSDVVDHFKKKHDSSQHILCLYCLKIFKVKFVSQGWGQTQTYYGHLLKHQSKTATRKCTLCRLTFFNTGDVKSHKKKDHMANHKGILGTNNRYTTPGQVMIKVPESGLHAKQQSVKSLNAPAVSKVLDFGGTRFPTVVNYLTCLECKMSMGTPDHFKKHIECSMCRFATSCSIAYANHMMGFHSGQMSSLNLNIPWERRMELPMHCLCGFSSRYGNRIANHLVYCTKRTCYRSKQHSPGEDGASDEEMGDPRRKPGASLLDVLGLVKKRSVATKIRRGSREDDRSIPPFRVNPSKTRSETTEEKSPPGGSSTASPKETSVSPPDKVSDAVDIPPELKGSRKWTTVKIQDQEAPSKASVFLGVKDESKEDVDDEGEVTPSAQNDDAEEGSDCGMKYKHEGKNTEDKQNIGECKPSVDLEFSVQSSKVVKSCIDKTELQKDDGKEKSLKVLADFDDEDDNDDVKSLEEDEINQLLKDVNDDKEDINQSDSKSEPGKDGDTADKTDLRVEDKNTDDLAVSQDGEADSTISDRKASVEQDDIESQMLESKGDNSACQEDNEESVDKENKSQEGETTADGKAADSGEEEKDNGGGGNEGGQLDTETMKSLVAEGKADNDGRNEVGVPDRETIKSMTAEEKPDDGSSNGGGEPDAETIESMAAEEKAHDGRNEEGEPVSETIESLAAEEKTDDGGSNGGGEPDTETIESMAAEEKAHDGRNEEGEPVSETIESLAAEEKAGNVDRNEGGEPDTEAIESMAAEEEADDGGSSCQEGESDTKINSLLNDSEAVTESSEKDQIISDLDEKESVKDSVHMEVSEKGTTENEKELLSDIENSESVAVETNEENTNYQKVEDCDGKQPSVSMEGDVTEKNTMEISAAKFCQDSKQSNDGMEIAKSNVELSDKEKSDEGASSSKHKSEITSDDCGDKGENTIHEQTKDSGQVKQGTPVEYNKEESPLRSERSGDKGERSSSEYKFSRDDKYQGSRTEHTKWSRSDHHHDHHGDRSHSSSYHDKRSQDSRHSSHHGDGRSYDRSHDYKRSQGQDYNRDRFHSSSYNDRRDNRGYQDNRNYHGNHPYGNRGQGDRRRDGHYDNYNRNQGHYNRGGRGGYGYGGGYQGNYR